MAETECRHFTGYKPCSKNSVCEQKECSSFARSGPRILLVHLGAMGAVLRSTTLLEPIRRRYPNAHITWVTESPNLIKNIGIDRILSLSAEDLLKLSALKFDLALVVDKSLVASGVLSRAQVGQVRGFQTTALGAIVPANPEAEELWQIGLDDARKFFVNQKSEQQLVHEAMALGPYVRDEYQVQLTEAEKNIARARRQIWSPERLPILGINTGCSPTLPAKKLSVEGHRQLILSLLRDSRFEGCSIVLLGGPEDTERNAEIAAGLPVLLSPTTKGVRDGLSSVAACDLLFSGDSLGMHMGIGLKLWVVAWFGPTCAPEIDLYDRGVKILTQAPCSPCWKRDCQQSRMCYDQVDFNEAVKALAQGLDWLTSSSKPHIPEISFSASL